VGHDRRHLADDGQLAGADQVLAGAAERGEHVAEGAAQRLHLGHRGIDPRCRRDPCQVQCAGEVG
jgi:hypothetical protein